jgi:diadenosine tetraphosphate (Ap4A) HIT family hydrolase
MSCEACDRIALIRRDENPNFIAEMSESFAVLADEQGYEGWCILLLKDHHEHLAMLSSHRQARLWDDVSRVAGGITRDLKPALINYECLGNLLHHIHWHVIPRYSNDPDPQMPIWVRPPEERRGNISPSRRTELIQILRRALDA